MICAFFGRHRWRIVVLGLLVVGCSGCSGCSGDQEQKADPGNLVPRFKPAAVDIPIAIGGSFRGFQLSATVNTDWEVTVVSGAGYGRLGISMPVLIFKTKDCSFAFVPEYNPALSLELGKYQSVKWSLKEGFAREIGAKFPSLKGKVVFEVSTEFPKTAFTSPSALSVLTFEKDRLNFTPLGDLSSKKSGLQPPLLPADGPKGGLVSFSDLLSKRSLRALPPHVFRFGNSSLLMPQKGYTWLDGTTVVRDENSLDLVVKWSPGQASLIPPHIHASATEGFWEPDAGYQWADGLQQPFSRSQLLLGSVVWTPGLASPNHANVIASATEGQWQPAVGFVWLTDDPKDLRVRSQFKAFAPGR